MRKIIIGVLALMVAGCGFFFILNRNDKEQISQPNSSQTNSDTANTMTILERMPNLPKQTVGSDADCSLYSLNELATVWGVPMVDTDINKVSELSTAGGTLYSCNYNETDSGLGVTYGIEYREYPTIDDAKQSINNTRSTVKYGDMVYYTLEEKVGVGDEAFFWSKYQADGGKNVNQQMYIRKDNVVFLLSGVNLDGVTPDYKDKLLTSYKLHFN
jgi:hypothetical protein